MGRLAWRNLWRNKGRTAIVLTAIAFSLGLLLTSYGLILDRSEKAKGAAVRTAGGNILVHEEGYWASMGSDYSLVDADTIADLLRGVDGVSDVIPRVIVNGLVTSARGAEGVMLRGIDPAAELAVYDYSPFLVEGTFLTGDEEAPIVLGAGIVESLEIELGDRVVLTGTQPDGEVTRALFRLSGVIQTNSGAVDDVFAFTTIAAAQEAMSMPGGLTQLGVVLPDDETRYEVQSRIHALLADHSQDTEVLTWDDAIPDLMGFIELDDKFALIYGIVIFMVVAFGIMNTLLMMVMERIRELGMLAAIGMSPKMVAKLVLIETALLTFVGVALGVMLGVGGHLLLSHYGLDPTAMSGGADLDIGGVSLHDMTIRSQLDPLRWTIATMIVVVLIFVSALYPAMKAARLNPVDAMRTYQ
ncbi:MAG: ABC-type lipoprotein release transport system permease subunit [Bradymonadia bacterium]|jgi:ABC-type lipoprotein release transport system permease subunit